MESTKRFENYPFWITLLSNIVSLGIYGLGFFIIFQLGWIYAIIYLLYILVLEFNLIRNHCTSCYYWGKTCGFGKGRISSVFFKKGDVKKFCKDKMTWKDLIPDMLVSAIPIITGIILLILSFNFILLAAVLLIILLMTFGNSFIRGKLTCKYCKQRELGCPADALFNKPK